MENPIPFLLIVAGVPAVAWLVLWTIYVIGFRHLAEFWFGEHDGYRRDREATRRRQSFESCCWWSAKFFYAMWFIGLMHGLLGDRLPNSSWIFWTTQVAMFVAGVSCAWAAVSRIRTPHMN